MSQGFFLTRGGGDTESAALAAALRMTYSISASNAANPLTTPTYDGSGQAVHPAVVYVPGGWNGYAYWMAMTPYPNGSAEWEDPSILASADGTTWVVPPGLTNPIDPNGNLPAHNADVSLILGQDNLLYCYWVYWNGSSSFWYVKSSADGVNWSVKTELLTAVGYNDTVSATVLWDGVQYVMWGTQISDNPNTLHRRTCPTPDGTWSSPIVCSMPSVRDVWHLSVVKNVAFREYHAFVVLCNRNVSGVGAKLAFSRSFDGIVWSEPKLLLDASAPGGWDDYWIYQASGIETSVGYDLFYAAYNTALVTHIGRTVVNLSV